MKSHPDADGSIRRRSVAFAIATLMSLGVLATSAYFSDGISVGQTFVYQPSNGTPGTPAACADLDFDSVIVGTPGDDVIGPANGAALIFGLDGNNADAGAIGRAHRHSDPGCHAGERRAGTHAERSCPLIREHGLQRPHLVEHHTAADLGAAIGARSRREA